VLSGAREDGLCPGCLLGLALQRPSTADASATGGMPSRIGAYRILDVLGQGGFGIVYLAEQERPRRGVALKVARPGIAGSEAMRRFEREAELLGRLQHPGIAQIFEAGTDDSGSGPRPFFAMELIDGEAITRYAQRTGLDRRGRIELIVEVCGAVQHAHDSGVLHRDLKPANILVDRNGRARILDFGVACVLATDAATVSMMTSAGQILGTIPYMSPEQLEGGSQWVDERADVYALGAILYELLTGELPIPVEGKSIHEAARMIAVDEPVRLGQRDRGMQGDLENVVTKALEKLPARRYASADALATDLRNVLGDRPVEAHSQSLVYRLGRFGRRHRAVTAIAAVVAVVTLTVVATIGGIRTVSGWLRTDLTVEQHISQATRNLRAMNGEVVDLGARSAAIHDLGSLATRDLDPEHYRTAISQLTLYIRQNLDVRRRPDAPEVSVDRDVYHIEDIRQALQAIQRLHRRSGLQPEFMSADLSDLSLIDLDMSGLDFSHCTFDRSFLSNTDWSGVNFQWARMRQVAAWGARFNGADFFSADLTDAKLASVDLTGTNLTEAETLDLGFCEDVSGISAAEAGRIGCKLVP